MNRVMEDKGKPIYLIMLENRGRNKQNRGAFAAYTAVFMRRRSPATTTTTNYGDEDEDENEDEDEVEVEGEGEDEDDDDDDDLRSSNIYSQCGRPSVVE
ncbi:hypothetical protein HZH68_000586 [Vespula germanica]|uniref:Uncharacterized protein n=1 Tax=Vespula germanica TaxID=30212 RepID=A0A834U651_VESGE|nr:hypothetical protein HZH68_000586 [Vespula germanica]